MTLIVLVGFGLIMSRTKSNAVRHDPMLLVHPMSLSGLVNEREVEAAIATYIDTRNADPKPFRWTKTADDMLDSVARFCRRTTDRRGGDVRVFPVSRSNAPWIFRRSRPLLCVIATGMSFGGPSSGLLARHVSGVPHRRHVGRTCWW
jgi:hypothetical protein